jgi:PIN domain nuclease of toxin-antitoxin system
MAPCGSRSDPPQNTAAAPALPCRSLRRHPGRPEARDRRRRCTSGRRTPGLSALSISEIAIKSRSGKLAVPEADIHETLADLDIRILPYTREHAFRLFGLPWHHTDPFDRQILAQALAENIPVVTSDEVFTRYEGIRVIW